MVLDFPNWKSTVGGIYRGILRHIYIYSSGWWFGTMEFDDFPFSWEFHHPNWRTHIFQRGRSTTNQLYLVNNGWYWLTMDNIDEFPYGMQTWRLRGNTGTKWRFNSLEKIMEVNGGFSSKPCLKIRDGKSAVNPIESPLHILKAHKYIESSLNPIQSPLNPINSPLNHMFVFVFSPCVSLFFLFFHHMSRRIRRVRTLEKKCWQQGL